MSCAFLPQAKTGHQGWHDLYMAALFEPDRASLSIRIDQAEKVIVTRGRELVFVSADVEQERRSLEAALPALRAHESCAKSRATRVIAVA